MADSPLLNAIREAIFEHGKTPDGVMQDLSVALGSTIAATVEDRQARLTYVKASMAVVAIVFDKQVN